MKETEVQLTSFSLENQIALSLINLNDKTEKKSNTVENRKNYKFCELKQLLFHIHQWLLIETTFRLIYVSLRRAAQIFVDISFSSFFYLAK